MAGEGNPDDPVQVRVQVSTHVNKVMGLVLDFWDNDSDDLVSE